MSANPTSTSTSTSNHFSPPPLQFPAENAPAPAPSNQPLLRHLAALSLITFFSIWGTLTREGLVALNTYNGNSVKPLIWAQAVGCLAMGWCIGNQKQIEGWYTPLYIGLATGYCGSVTTFSSWMLQVFQAFGDQEHFHRGGLHNVMDALTQTSITFGMSLISLKAGQSISKSLTFEIILILLTPSRWGEIRSESREEGEKIERDELDEEIVEETERAEKDEERDATYPPANLESEDGNKKQGSEVVGREPEIKRDGLDDRIVGEMEKAEREEICGRTKDASTQNSNSTSTSNTTSTQSNLRSSEPRRKSKSPKPTRSEDISFSKDSTSNRLSPTFTKDLIFISIGPILWISSISLCIFKPDSNFRPITFSIVFSPLGSILRWYLSRFNSISRTKRFPYFPLGTLTANLLATMILSIAFICQHFGRGVGISGSTGGIGNNILDCNVLYGIQEGFCGTLSTVSTFVVELNKLKPKRRAIGYAGFSWLIGILICVVVVGIPWWSRGMDGSCVGITI